MTHDTLCSLGIAVSWLLSLGAGSALGRACNGDEALCDRPYDQVAHLTTHNAHSNVEDRFTVPLPNQYFNVTGQLERGVRAMMLDTYLYRGRAYLCHGICGPWGATKMRNTLREIAAFLGAHPNEVLTIIFESYLDEERTAQAFSDTGLSDELYAHLGGPWPSLGEMIDAGTRIVVFTDDPATVLPWHHYVWDYAWETPFGSESIEEFTCAEGRGTPGSELFILNHYVLGPLGSERSTGLEVNQYALLQARMVQCWGDGEHNPGYHIPNFVNVDQHDLGDPLGVIGSLNRSWPDPPLWMTVSGVVPGEVAELRVEGAEPGEPVYFAASSTGQGLGGCPPVLQGACSDLLDPVERLGWATADPHGVATWTTRVPLGLPPGPVSTQAFLPRPGSGTKSVAVESVVPDSLGRAGATGGLRPGSEPAPTRP